MWFSYSWSCTGTFSSLPWDRSSCGSHYVRWFDIPSLLPDWRITAGRKGWGSTQLSQGIKVTMRFSKQTFDYENSIIVSSKPLHRRTIRSCKSSTFVTRRIASRWLTPAPTSLPCPLKLSGPCGCVPTPLWFTFWVRVVSGNGKDEKKTVVPEGLPQGRVILISWFDDLNDLAQGL